MIGAPIIADAIAAYTEACAEAAYWQAVCARWSRACGRGVWREGHPSDLHKLRQRRIWRARRRISRHRLGVAIETWRLDMGATP